MDLTQSRSLSCPLVYDAPSKSYMPSHPHYQSELDFRVSTCVDRLVIGERKSPPPGNVLVNLCPLKGFRVDSRSPIQKENGGLQQNDGGSGVLFGIAACWSRRSWRRLAHWTSNVLRNLVEYPHGTGWDVAAIPDSHYEYNWSCGCCGDMDHFDLSYHTFDKLAPRHYGVIGLKYRPVACPSSYLENRHHLGRKLKEGEMVVLDERFERPEGVQGALPSV
ncbi:hypothetical protein BSKO_04513 [Bryopsis sp. KO-2023]|nr:hypothetical protein BSKO_04513 [Bryopsis sp. KO-2023]